MATDWHVTYQDPHKYFGQGGHSTDVVDVHFRVDTDPGSGHEDYVTIDASRYNADTVAAMVQEKVDRIKAVAAL
jgi:hypothetical protein